MEVGVVHAKGRHMRIHTLSGACSRPSASQHCCLIYELNTVCRGSPGQWPWHSWHTTSAYMDFGITHPEGGYRYCPCIFLVCTLDSQYALGLLCCWNQRLPLLQCIKHSYILSNVPSASGHVRLEDEADVYLSFLSSSSCACGAQCTCTGCQGL